MAQTPSRRQPSASALPAPGRGSRRPARRFLRRLATGLALACALPAAAQLPVGPTVASGTAAIATVGGQMTVTNGPGAIIHWQGFSIGPGQGVHFSQQSAASQVLNRVTGQDPSRIFGTLASNGGVWLINPHGVLFGPSARVDVARLVASTVDIANADFLADRYRFTASGPAGAEVLNQGDIRTTLGGRVWLLGDGVRNEGRVDAPGGEIVLAAGKSVEIVDSGTPNLVVKVSGTGNRAANLGTLSASGGRIDVHAGIVNQAGVVQADSIGTDASGQIVLGAAEDLTLGAGSETRAAGGRVRLDAGGTARLEGAVDVSDAGAKAGSIAVRAGRLAGAASGSLRADGQTGGNLRIEAQGAAEIASTLSAIGLAEGGRIEVTGDAVRLSGATLDASGGTTGGVMHVGGGWQGGGDLPQAREVVVDAQSVVRANGGAGNAGGGGEVVLWSTEGTDHQGLVQALEGGRIEVSSKGIMQLTGEVQAGTGGSVLFDPKNLIVQALGTVGGISVPEATFGFDPAATSFIQPSTIVALLDQGVDVTLQANNNITVNDGIFVTAPTGLVPGNLTLQAGRNIDFFATVDMGGGNLTAIAGDPGANPLYRDPGTPTILIDTSQEAILRVPDATTTLAAIDGIFVNPDGDFAIVTGATGRWLIYAADPATTTEGFSSYNKHYSQPFVAGSTPSYAGSGNWFLYSLEPVLSVTPSNQAIPFGDPLPLFTPSYAGFIDGDTLATAGISGTPTWNVAGPFSTGGLPLAGPHDVSYLAGLASSLGYRFADNVASLDELTVLPPPVPDILPQIPADEVRAANDATQRVASLATAPVETGAGVVVDRTMALVCSTTNTFAPLDLASMTREQAELVLELRRQCKKELYADAIAQLERDPTLADVPLCTDAAQAQAGTCRLTEAQRQALAGAIAVDKKAEKKVEEKRAEAPAPPAAPLPQIERKIAVLFGINDYADRRIPSLDNAAPDAVAVSKVLSQKLGYEVRVVKNATKADIVRTLNRLAAETTASDSVAIYYAGHGDVVKKTGRGYWIPADASPSDPKQWVSNDDISRMLAEIRAKQLAVISDSCYSGALTKEGRLSVGEGQVRPEAVLDRRSVVVMSSGGDEPVADSGKGGHSIFAWYLMQDLKRVEEWQAGTSLFPRVRRQVSRAFPQTPQYGAAVSAGHEPGGDYLFEARPPAR